MRAYFARRLLLIIPTFLGITVLVFTMTRFVPGGPIERMIAEAQMKGGEMGGTGGGSSRVDEPLSEEQIQELREFYGFDKPIHVAYLEWLTKVFKLDLGTSTRYFEPVWGMIKERIPIGLFFGLHMFFVTYFFCIPLGIVKALKHKSVIDNVTSIIVFTGYAIPGFIIGIFLVFYFAGNLEWFPLGGFTGDDYDELTFFGKVGDIYYHAALPLISYIIPSLAVMTFMMKNSLMDNLAADYVRTAIAKGVPFKRAVFKHALQNSLIPIATSFGNVIMLFLTGSFLIETIFNINGFGLLGYESVVQRDYPVVMGVLVLTAVLKLVANILSDVCVAFVDPRVQFK